MGPTAREAAAPDGNCSPPHHKVSGNERAVLHNDSDRLSQRRPAHRPCLRIHRDRLGRAVQAAGRIRRAVPHRHRRPRPQDGRDGRGAGHPDRGARPAQLRRFPTDAGQAGHLLRPVHPHLRRRPLRGVQGDLAPDERVRRHLPRRVQGLVLDPRRTLLHRSRDDRRTRRGAGRDRDRRTGDVDRGADVLLPAVGLRRQTARPLPGPSRVHRARRPAQRGGQLRLRRAARPVDLAHDVRLGCAGSRPSRSRDVRVGRRADQLSDRRRLSRYVLAAVCSGSGPPICT